MARCRDSDRTRGRQRLTFAVIPVADHQPATVLRSVVVNLYGESYHRRDHHAPVEILRRTTTGTHQPLH